MRRLLVFLIFIPALSVVMASVPAQEQTISCDPAAVAQNLASVTSILASLDERIDTDTPVALRADLRMARGIMMQLQSNCFEEVPITPVQIYINSNQGVNARSCPRTSCEAVDVLSPGTAVTSIGIQDGDTVSGSSEWHRIRIDGEDAFIHASLVSLNRPAPRPTNAPVQSQPVQPAQNQQSLPVSTAVPLAPPVVSSGGGCPNLGATCGQLRCDQAYACLGAGNAGLDRDDDGVPCESICPGG